MKKRFALILCFTLAFLMLAPASQATAYNKVDVYINGTKSIAGIDEAGRGPLAGPVVVACGADSISWDQKTKTATIYARGISIYITEGNTYIVSNGRYFASNEPVRNINDRLYLPVRLIASAFASSAEWSPDYTVRISDSGQVPVSGDEYYNQTDVYWLSRIINSESGAEPFKGKIAVGNVVLNRVNSSLFPNTVYEVIFDKKYGTQFSPTVIGTIYKEPNNDSVIAAKICLEGYSLNNKILYFMNPDIATNNWISQNRPYAFRIGNHTFYY